jgi:hypothetical protein
MFRDLAEHLAEFATPSPWEIVEERAHLRKLKNREYLRDRLQTDPAFRKRHREHVAAWKRKNRKSDPTTPCIECGKPKPPKFQSYCSHRCENRRNNRLALRRRRQRRGVAKPETSTCAECGELFAQSLEGSGRPKSYCSKTCGYRAANRRKRCKSTH